MCFSLVDDGRTIGRQAAPSLRRRSKRPGGYLTGKGERLVLVSAPFGENFQRIGPFPDDLEKIPVGIVEVDTFLADMVDRAQDGDARRLQGEVRIPEVVLGFHRKSHMPDAEAVPAGEICIRRSDSVQVRALEQVERVAETAEGKKEAAVLRVLLENLEAQDARVKVLGPFEITHRDEDVTQALQFDHFRSLVREDSRPVSIHASPHAVSPTGSAARARQASALP